MIPGRTLPLASSFSAPSRKVQYWTGAIIVHTWAFYSSAYIRAKASAIAEKEVWKKWHKEFERRHPDLRTLKPSKLDPKRAKVAAKHFNEAVINDYFDKLDKLHSR
jgi:hypothetical protein